MKFIRENILYACRGKQPVGREIGFIIVWQKRRSVKSGFLPGKSGIYFNFVVVELIRSFRRTRFVVVRIMIRKRRIEIGINPGSGVEFSVRAVVVAAGQIHCIVERKLREFEKRFIKSEGDFIGKIFREIVNTAVKCICNSRNTVIYNRFAAAETVAVRISEIVIYVESASRLFEFIAVNHRLRICIAFRFGVIAVLCCVYDCSAAVLIDFAAFGIEIEISRICRNSYSDGVRFIQIYIGCKSNFMR